MMRAKAIVELQQERGHASALAASGPCCRIAPLAGRRRTKSVFAFPKLSWILPLPKLPDIQSTVSARRGAFPSVTASGHRASRKKAQSRSRPARQGPTGKYCAQPASKASRIDRAESVQPKHG